MEKAKGEFEINVDSNISVNEKGKLKPQIKIINVSKDEVDVVDNIKWKNPWLENLIQDADNDFKIIKEMNAKDNNYKHYVIKCTPQIRKAIYERNDKLCTLHSCCWIYDCYMPYQCYKCQEFGQCH